MTTTSVPYPKGLYNPAGITEVYFCYPEDVSVFPALADPASATTLSSLVTYSDDIVMKTGKQFFQVYCTLETGQVKSTLVGSRDGKGYETSVEISFPGNDPVFLGFKAYGANRDFILLVKEKNGKVRVIGDLDNTAIIDSDEEMSGQKIADARKSTLTFKASGPTPAPIYAGDLDSLLVAAA